MLKLEEQIERIADAAFAQTSPVEWSATKGKETPRDGRWRSRRVWVVAGAAALVMVLVGSLIAILDDSATPTAPVSTSTQTGTVADTIAETKPTVTATATPTTVTEAPATSAPTSDPVPPVIAEGQRPLVAIDANGDAVIISDADMPPTPLFDEPDHGADSQLGDGANAPERVAIAADASVAYIGLCCAPPVGTMLTVNPPSIVVEGPDPTYGYAPALNPSSTHLARAVNQAVIVTDLTTSEDTTIETSVNPIQDLTWIDDTTLAVLGSQPGAWNLTIISDDGTDPVLGPTRPFAIFDQFSSLRFAGLAQPGEIAVHDIGTDRILSGPIDNYGNNNGDGRGSSLAVLTLPAPALSAWYTDPDHLVWIDTSNVIHEGDRTIPGTYTWARR